MVADCNAHGALTQHYSVSQLQGALANIPADVAEYTNCYNVIQHQLYAQLGGKHTSGGGKSSSSGGGSFLPTPVIVVIAVLVVGGGALAGVALQRRSSAAGES